MIKNLTHIASAACLMLIVTPAGAAGMSGSDNKVKDTTMRGTDAFVQNRDVAKMMRKMHKSEIKRQNHHQKAQKQIKSISPYSNSY